MKHCCLNILFLLASLVLYAQPGTLDPSFAQKGYLGASFFERNIHDEQVSSLLVLEDGSYYVAIHSNDHTVVGRYLSNGKPDMQYGKKGLSEPFALSQGKLIRTPEGDIMLAGVVVSAAFRAPYGPYTQYNLVLVKLDTRGNMDPAFGKEGKVERDWGAHLESAVVQPDGKILVGGSERGAGTFDYDVNSFRFARFHPDGSPDLSFGKDGYVYIENRGEISSGYMNGFALLGDGRFVAATNVYDFNMRPPVLVIVRRYLSNGTEDASFKAAATLAELGLGAGVTLLDLAAQPDGKLLLAYSLDTDNKKGLLIRLMADGSLDTSFGTGGKLEGNTRMLVGLSKMTVLSDQKILLTGIINPTGADQDLALYRLLPDGSADESFGNEGLAVISFPGVDYPHDVVQGPGQQLLLGGYAISAPGVKPDFSVYRVREDGRKDLSFGSRGRFTSFIPGSEVRFTGTVVQKDRKVLAVGNVNYFRTKNRDIILVRYLPDGRYDQEFGAAGVVRTHFGGDEFAHAIELQPDGKIVVAGYIDSKEGATDFLVIRYHPDGSLDRSFGDRGKVFTKFGGRDVANTLAIQPDGRILVAGYSASPQWGDQLAITRYLKDGSKDYSFDGDSKKLFRYLDKETVANKVVLQPDGKILLTGSFQVGEFPMLSSMFLVRLSSNGALENEFQQVGSNIPTSDVAVTAGKAIFPLEDGRILLVGSAIEVLSSHGSGYSSLLICYIYPDDSEMAGYVDVTIRELNMEVTSAVLQPDQKLVAAGFDSEEEFYNVNDKAIIVRVDETGKMDASFGVDGVQRLEFGNGDGFQDLALDGNRVYAVGSFTQVSQLGLVSAFQLGETGAGQQVQASEEKPNLQTQTPTVIQPLKTTSDEILKATVWPNPAANYFTLNLGSNSSQPVTLRVLDAMGKVLEQRTSIAVNGSLQIGGQLKSGIYFVEIIQGRERKVLRVVKVQQ